MKTPDDSILIKYLAREKTTHKPGDIPTTTAQQKSTFQQLEGSIIFFVSKKPTKHLKVIVSDA